MNTTLFPVSPAKLHELSTAALTKVETMVKGMPPDISDRDLERARPILEQGLVIEGRRKRPPTEAEVVWANNMALEEARRSRLAAGKRRLEMLVRSTSFLSPTSALAYVPAEELEMLINTNAFFR